MKKSYNVELERLSAISLLVLCLIQASHVQEATAIASVIGQPQAQQTKLVELVKSSYQLAEHWLLHNLWDKGIFVYLNHPSRDHYPNKNNMIRQLMASRLLAELNRTRPVLRPAHQKAIVMAIAVLTPCPAVWAQVLNEDCTARVLNRTVQVNPDGSFLIRNVPVEPGFFRVRVDCNQDGTTFGGQSVFVVIDGILLPREQRMPGRTCDEGIGRGEFARI